MFKISFIGKILLGVAVICIPITRAQAAPSAFQTVRPNHAVRAQTQLTRRAVQLSRNLHVPPNRVQNQTRARNILPKPNARPVVFVQPQQSVSLAPPLSDTNGTPPSPDGYMDRLGRNLLLE